MNVYGHRPRRNSTGTAWLCLVFVLLLQPGSDAQTYSIPWSKIGAGGGTSSGGLYRMSGLIGQHDAHAASGLNFELEGGFWAVAVSIASSETPVLRAFRVDNGVILAWTAPPEMEFVLEESNLLHPTSQWTVVVTPAESTNNRFTVTVPANFDLKFFRLRRIEPPDG